jgi:hypothetical protein
MAGVIDFSKRKTEGKNTDIVFGPAQVIIFPGVRVERLVDVPQAKVARRMPRRSNQATAEELE